MNLTGYRHSFRYLLMTVIAGGIFLFCAVAAATETANPDNRATAEAKDTRQVGLAVTGASAGITTQYFEQAVTDALNASGLFSGVDNTGTDAVVMSMMRAESVFPVIEDNDNLPYFLTIRVIKVEAPSFSVRMTVSIDAVWTLYRNEGGTKTELMHEKIRTTYTGGIFEGGISGASRVRVALEGAERENARIGIEKIAALDLGRASDEVIEQGNENTSSL